MEPAADARTRRGNLRATRTTAKPSKYNFGSSSHGGGDSSADDKDGEEDEEGKSPMDEAGLDTIDATYRISHTARELNTLECGTLVHILNTPDVEQRVPHTMHKVGVVEEVPQHPNTWYKVRIRDGNVVYKYRPSALEVIDDADNVSPPPSPPLSVTHREENEEGEDEEREKKEDEFYNEDGQEKHEKDDPDEKYFKIGTQVRLKIKKPYRTEKYMKKFNGKNGIVIGHREADVIVQLDGNTNFELTLRRKHLVLVTNEGAKTEARQSDKEEEKLVTVLKKKRGKGKLLSTLDPDMWVDRKCRINVGKFKGQHGCVLRSGNGWVQLRLENSSENTAKRAYELTLLEDMEMIKALHAKSLEKERKRREESRAHGFGTRHKANGRENEINDDYESDHSGQDDPLAAEQTEDSQEEDGGQRSRRVSTRGNYGISWIEKKVLLPGSDAFGIVKKADRDTCTVEIQASKVLQVFKKKDLELVVDSHAMNGRQIGRSRNNAKAREKLGLVEGSVLMGTTPSRYIAFQDLVKRFAMRRREKLKKRPNLTEWLARLNLKYLENGSWDKSNPSVVTLVAVSHCEICGVEKETVDGHCWNDECPRCPAFNVDAFDLKNDDAFMRIPAVPFVNNIITASLCAEPEVLLRKRNSIVYDVAPVQANDEIERDAESLTSPSLETKNTQIDAVNVEEIPIGETKGKSAEVAARKRPVRAFADQDESKRGKIPSKRAKPEEKPRVEAASPRSEAADTGTQSPSGFRPHYDSVFSR